MKFKKTQLINENIEPGTWVNEYYVPEISENGELVIPKEIWEDWD